MSAGDYVDTSDMAEYDDAVSSLPCTTADTAGEGDFAPVEEYAEYFGMVKADAGAGPGGY